MQTIHPAAEVVVDIAHQQSYNYYSFTHQTAPLLYTPSERRISKDGKFHHQLGDNFIIIDPGILSMATYWCMGQLS
jgi:hypothetical protein